MRLHLSLLLSGLLLVSAHDVRVGDERDSYGDARNHSGGLRASGGGHDQDVREGDVVSHHERSHHDKRVKHDRTKHDIGDRASRGNGNNGNNGNGNGGKPPAHGRNKIKTKNCNNNSRAPHCGADVEFNLSSEEDLDFTLPNGKTITFKKRPGGNGKKKGKAWTGESPSGGAANIIDRVNKATGEHRYFASLVDMEDGEWNVCLLSRDHNGDQVIDCQPGEDLEFASADDRDRLLMENRVEVQHPVPAFSADDGRNLQSTHVIDVMVLWTLEAECRHSGLEPGCSLTSTTENNMRGVIDLEIQHTNVAFINSGINAELRLVHAYRANYNEPGTSNEDTVKMLEDLQAGIGNSNVLRDEYGADLVAMMYSEAEYCGMANAPNEPDEAYGFSISKVQCAGVYVFAHEVGHNMGCAHDRGTDNACNDSELTNYGWQDPLARFKTIMAGHCRNDQCDNNPANNICAKVQMFSNNYGLTTPDGNPAGNAMNDNAGHINSVVAAVAAYRQTITTPPPTPPPTLPPTLPPTSPPVTTPTLPPTQPPTPAPVPTGSTCVDVAGWYDSEGPYFDCDWYEQNAPSSCTNYGGSYANFGRTANQACCACNGDVTAACMDTAGWYDSAGSTYNCDWYGYDPSYCSSYGDDYENFGETANQACCVCGGGF